MLRIPKIDCVERSPGNARIEFAVPASLEYFDGHFPGCPLLPGVVQIGWAIELAREHIGFDASFRSLSAVKFMRVIQPGDRVTLLLAFDAARRELEFEYRCGGRPCSSGRGQFEEGSGLGAWGSGRNSDEESSRSSGPAAPNPVSQ